MSFLAPAFLFAGLAVAVPLLLHLRQRKSKERFAFPSLMFLEEVPHATIRRRRLRDRLLLLLRSLAVLLLALAFAQPALRSGFGSEGSDATELYVLVDRSASMAIGDRWGTAKRLVAERLSQAAAGDLVTLALVDEDVELALMSVADHEQVIRVLNETEPRDRRTVLSAGIRVIRPLILDQIADTGNGRSAEVLLISDFPRNGSADMSELELPPGTELTLRNVADSTPSNHWVRSVELHRGIEPASGSDRERVRVSATIGTADWQSSTEPTEQDPPQVDVTLTLDGRELETQTVALAGRSTPVAFAPVALDSGRASIGEVQLSADAFARDDTFYFTASATDALSVLLVGRQRDDAQVFVERALGSLQSPRYRLVRKSNTELGPSDLEGVHAAVVFDAGALSAGALGALEEFVRDGGGLLVAYGRNAIAKQLPSWIELREGREVEQSRSGVRWSSVAESHPALSALSGSDWNSAPFFRHFALKQPSTAAGEGRSSDAAGGNDQGAGTSGDGATVLARFDNGDIALLEQRLDAGVLIGFGSTLDTAWNDFPRQAVFLGWLDQALQHLGNFVPSKESYSVGQPALVEVDAERSNDWILLSPSGAPTDFALPTDRSPRGSANLLVRFEESGHSSLRPRASESADGRVYAANLDRRESELSAADLDVLDGQLRPQVETRVEASGISPAIGEQSFWWLVLYAVLLLLVSEGVLASRKRRAPALLQAE